jgi:DNA-binding CsgD family transcriptional regulator/tetratricopeptide (TPR) repeat protein
VQRRRAALNAATAHVFRAGAEETDPPYHECVGRSWAGGPDLVGRGTELRSLRDAVEHTANGNGGLVLVEGEAGIGKTRLLDELALHANALGVDVRRGAAEELEEARPFGSLIEALGAPDGVSIVAGAGDRRFLAQDAFVDHVERLSAQGPMALAIDDLHWADRATLATLWALARRTADLGLLLALAFRPAPRMPALTRVVDGCAGLGAQLIQLGPIADDALLELATDVVGGPVAPSLQDALLRTRGNPFVAIEMLRAFDHDDDLADEGGARDLLSDGIPPQLRAALLRRFTALSDGTRQALSVAAVLGGVGRVDELAELLGLNLAEADRAVSEATAAGLLEPTGDVLAFRHDLIREALYEDLPESVRAGWHREAARLLENRADPAVVARHLSLGATRGDTSAVDGLAHSAAAIAGDDPDAAAELLARAIALASDPVVGADLGVARAAALLTAARAEDAVVQADAVLADDAAPLPVRARAYIARANAAFQQGHPREAVEGFAAALATGALDERSTAFVLGREAASLVWQPDLDAALERGEQALAEGRRLDLLPVQVEALAVRCTVHAFRAEPDAAVPLGREAVALAGDHSGALRRTPHNFLGLALLAADQLDEARDVLEEGRRRATELGQVLVLRTFQMAIARIAWFAGRWDDTVAEIETALSLAEDYGVRFGLATSEATRGLVSFHRGDHAAARASIERHRAPTRGGPDDAAGSELHVLLRALLLEVDGKVNEASTTLLELFELERSFGMDTARLWPGANCVRLALAAGHRDAARDVADDLAGIAARAKSASARATAAYARGLVDGAPDVLAEAPALFAAAGRPLDQLEALEAHAGLISAVGRRDEAVAQLREALAIADRLGASHDGRRITAALRGLGESFGARGRRSERSAHGWESLTDTEREVARLVDDGLRNAEIAERLFVSRRTVEGHVSRLYAKLGAPNRVALARAIRERSEHTAV